MDASRSQVLHWRVKGSLQRIAALLAGICLMMLSIAPSVQAADEPVDDEPWEFIVTPYL